MNPQEENTPPIAPIQNPDSLKGKTGDDFFIRPLRTYEDDVKNAVQKDSISTAKILMAEQQKRQIEQADIEENSPKSETNMIKIIASIILFVLGLGIIGGGIYYYFQKRAAEIPQQVTILTSNNFIDTEDLIKINVTNKVNREVVGEIRNILKNSSSMKEDSIKEIKLTKTVVTTENGKEFSNNVDLTTEEFMKILEAREPDALTRSLDSKFLLGIHKTKISVEPFILFQTNDYEISYAKMLEWEWVLVPDIQDIFYKNLGSSQTFIKYEEDAADNAPIVMDQNTASTTNISEPIVDQATTTSSKYEYRNFKDLILANRDTRSISNTDGKLLFFYSFIDRKHLLMTTNVETMNTIINRMNSAKLVR